MSHIAADLASNMLGLLVNGPNAPIQRIIREGLMENDGLHAEALWNELSATMQESTTPSAHVAECVAHFVGHVLRKAVREAQDNMFTRA